MAKRNPRPENLDAPKFSLEKYEKTLSSLTDAAFAYCQEACPKFCDSVINSIVRLLGFLMANDSDLAWAVTKTPQGRDVFIWMGVGEGAETLRLLAQTPTKGPDDDDQEEVSDSYVPCR